MTDEGREILDQLKLMKAQLDGLPLINRAIAVLHQDVRMMRAAINDLARTNVTAGEIEALHTDVNQVMSKQVEMEIRIATLERLTK